MNRSRSGITGRCTEHIDRFAGALDLVFEKISYQLQPKVFERQGRTMKQFEDEQVFRQLRQRRAHRVAEVAVTLVHYLNEMIGIMVVVKKPENVPGQSRVWQSLINEQVTRQKRKIFSETYSPPVRRETRSRTLSEILLARFPLG